MNGNIYFYWNYGEISNLCLYVRSQLKNPSADLPQILIGELCGNIGMFLLGLEVLIKKLCFKEKLGFQASIPMNIKRRNCVVSTDPNTLYIHISNNYIVELKVRMQKS